MAMALPISATPRLTGKDAEQFIATIKKDVRKPSRPVATPKLQEAHSLILKDARRQK